MMASEAHVWLVRLDDVEARWPNWEHVLAVDENAKARRMRRLVDRRRCAIARACLRFLISNYTGLAPEQIRFTYNGFGKPFLAESDAAQRLNFNVSHSGDFALIGFVLGRSIGVDVELIRSDLTYPDLASEICTPEERALLDSLREELRLPELYRYWTLKEAAVKAIGKGLSFPHRRITVSRSISRFSLSLPGSWTTHIIEELPGYAASVVISGEVTVIHHHVGELTAG